MSDRKKPGIGVTLMTPPEQLAAVARGFEEAGVDSLWLGEYFQSALVRAAVVGAATSRVTVGTHVLQAFARSPLATALAAGDLQDLTRGRFVLGIGSQVPGANRRWHGIDTPRPVAMLKEYVAGLKALFGARPDDPVSFMGTSFRFDVPGLRPARTQLPPPVFIGGAGRGTAAAAIAVADGLMGHLLWTPAHIRRTIRPITSSTGVDRFPVTMARLAAPSSVSGWERDASHTLAHYATTPQYQSLLDAVGTPVDRDALITALKGHDVDAIVDLAGSLLDTFCICDAASLRRQSAEAELAGVDTLILVVPATMGDSGRSVRYEEGLQRLVSEA